MLFSLRLSSSMYVQDAHSCHKVSGLQYHPRAAQSKFLLISSPAHDSLCQLASPGLLQGAAALIRATALIVKQCHRAVPTAEISCRHAREIPTASRLIAIILRASAREPLQEPNPRA